MKITYDFEDGSYVQTQGPWNSPVTGAALCPDGKIRKLKRISHISGNIHHLSCAISYGGKTVSGIAHIVGEGLKFTPAGLNANAFQTMSHHMTESALVLDSTGKYISVPVDEAEAWKGNMEIPQRETEDGIDLPVQLCTQ